MLISLGGVQQKICFKCDPETFAELSEREGIVPAPYVGRYKWALLERLDVVRDSELRDLIGQSYSMVVAKTETPTRRGRPTNSSRSGAWMKSGSSRNFGI